MLTVYPSERHQPITSAHTPWNLIIHTLLNKACLTYIPMNKISWFSAFPGSYFSGSYFIYFLFCSFVFSCSLLLSEMPPQQSTWSPETQDTSCTTHSHCSSSSQLWTQSYALRMAFQAVYITMYYRWWKYDNNYYTMPGCTQRARLCKGQ